MTGSSGPNILAITDAIRLRQSVVDVAHLQSLPTERAVSFHRDPEAVWSNDIPRTCVPCGSGQPALLKSSTLPWVTL